jgi:hypothetical protein
LPEGQELSACGRAYAVWKTICDTVSAVWDYKYSYPWAIIGNIKAHSPTNLTTSGVWVAISQAILTDSVWDADDVEDETKRQHMLCEMASEFTASAGPLTDAEWDAIKRATNGYGDVLDLFIRNLYNQVATLAIGRDRLSVQAQAGALDNTQNCDCPQTGPSPLATDPDPETGWYLGPDISADLIKAMNLNENAWWEWLQTYTPEHDAFGLFYMIDAVPSLNDFKTADQNGSPAAITYLPDYVNADINVAAGLNHGEDMNNIWPHLQIDNDTVAALLALQRGFTAYYRHTGGVDSANDGTNPDWPIASTGAALWYTGVPGLHGEIAELRLIHNINSPSHSA